MKLMPDAVARLFRPAEASARRQLPAILMSVMLLVFFVVIFWDMMVISIHPGQLGVLYKRLGAGTVVDTVYREGLHIIFPFNKMYIYDVRKQQYSDALDVLTLDGLTVHVQYTTRYYLDKDTLPLLHQRVGPDYVKVVVRPDVRAIIRTVFGQYKPEQIYTSQKAIQEQISEFAKIRLAARFVALDDVPIEMISLPSRISQAIEAKMVQQQIDAEYDFRISIAKKEAERLQIESDGLKQYNDTIHASLTPAVLEWQGILASRDLAKSSNAKILVFGQGKTGLPLLLGKE